MVRQKRLDEYTERSSRLLDSSPQMDEENTKRKLIEPLVEQLGWDMLSQEVELEYSIPMGSGTRKVDYALKLEDTPVVFVEAKGADTTLEESHEDQLRSYMRQVGVDWGLLTNGRSFRIFRRDDSSRRPAEISLAEFSLNEIGENTQPLTALSRSSLESGESKRIAESIEQTQTAIRQLRDQKESISEDVTRVITEQIGEAASQQVENEAKGFIDDLIASLEERTHSSDSTPTEPSPTNTGGKYGVRILKSGSEVSHVTADTQADVSAQFVDYLIENEGLLRQIDLPYLPGTKRGDKAFINDEPIHPDGSRMRAHRELRDGYFLFTSLNAGSKQRYLRELAEKVGLSCEFVGNW